MMGDKLADYYIQAMRCPASIQPRTFGLWTIRRITHVPLAARALGVKVQTLLYRMETVSLMHPHGTIVMDDSRVELQKHLPICIHAHGRVLVTGLGLGCVVRGLLANPMVTHVDVIEIDKAIIKAVAPSFGDDPRLTIWLGDALKKPIGASWDFAWHDIHAEEELQLLHSKLFVRYRKHAAVQGAWGFPRQFKRVFAQVIPLIGGQTRRRRHSKEPRISSAVKASASGGPASPAPVSCSGAADADVPFNRISA